MLNTKQFDWNKEKRTLVADVSTLNNFKIVRSTPTNTQRIHVEDNKSVFTLVFELTNRAHDSWGRVHFWKFYDSKNKITAFIFNDCVFEE